MPFPSIFKEPRFSQTRFVKLGAQAQHVPSNFFSMNYESSAQSRLELFVNDHLVRVRRHLVRVRFFISFPSISKTSSIRSLRSQDMKIASNWLLIHLNPSWAWLAFHMRRDKTVQFVLENKIKVRDDEIDGEGFLKRRILSGHVYGPDDLEPYFTGWTNFRRLCVSRSISGGINNSWDWLYINSPQS